MSETQSSSYQQGFQHRWLWRWSQNDPLVEKLIYSLKGGKHGPTFDFLGELFVAYRITQLPKKATLVYPSKGPPDHGSQWAQSLGKLLNFPTHSVLLEASAKQSLLSRSDRQKRVAKPVRIRGEIIFVDDIYTTGSTAQAVYKALGRPSKFAIWTIFYRPYLR